MFLGELQFNNTTALDTFQLVSGRLCHSIGNDEWCATTYPCSAYDVVTFQDASAMGAGGNQNRYLSCSLGKGEKEAKLSCTGYQGQSCDVKGVKEWYAEVEEPNIYNQDGGYVVGIATASSTCDGGCGVGFVELSAVYV